MKFCFYPEINYLPICSQKCQFAILHDKRNHYIASLIKANKISHKSWLIIQTFHQYWNHVNIAKLFRGDDQNFKIHISFLFLRLKKQLSLDSGNQDSDTNCTHLKVLPHRNLQYEWNTVCWLYLRSFLIMNILCFLPPVFYSITSFKESSHQNIIQPWQGCLFVSKALECAPTLHAHLCFISSPTTHTTPTRHPHFQSTYYNFLD